jgi:uncharacterized protein
MPSSTYAKPVLIPRSMSKNKSKSPCVDICKIDKKTSLCKGCLRTKREIKTWKTLSKAEQRDVVGRIALRKAA